MPTQRHQILDSVIRLRTYIMKLLQMDNQFSISSRTIRTDRTKSLCKPTEYRPQRTTVPAGSTRASLQLLQIHFASRTLTQTFQVTFWIRNSPSNSITRPTSVLQPKQPVAELHHDKPNQQPTSVEVIQLG